MKKLARAALMALLIALIGSLALAEADLSGLSYDELLELRQQNDITLLSSDAYPEFKVTQGEYTIGVDFPAGTYKAVCSTLTALKIYDLNGDLVHDVGVEQGDPIDELTLTDGYRMTSEGGTFTMTKLGLSPVAPEGLAELKAQYDEALKATDVYTNFKIVQGTYTVGEDIAAGVYTMSTPILSAIGLFHGDPADESNLDLMFTVTMNEPIGRIELKEGTIVSVSGMSDLDVATFIGMNY